MLYHASPLSGLTTLIPHASTHKTAYVYALDNPLTALLFGAPKDDFDLLMDEEDGHIVLSECYPGALARIYQGKSCSLYTVGKSAFKANQTGWAPEWVCPSAVPVLHEDHINDLYAFVLNAEAKGLCTLRRFTKEPSYLSFLREELSERISAFGLTRTQLKEDPRFTSYLFSLLDL